jgi:hypothetical protein
LGIGLAAGLSLALSACAPDVMLDDLPQLQLQGAEPPPPHVTNIKVENGKGEVLYNGPRPDDGRITANPSPTQLDGTMKVTRSFSDGSPPRRP